MTKKNAITVGLLAGITTLTMLAGAYITYNKQISINAQAINLNNLNQYGNLSINPGMLSSFAEFTTETINTIPQLLQVKDAAEEQLKKYQSLFESQSSYYKLFLRNIYLPSLNIRKDPYTQMVDTDIIGKKYLERDHFQDLYLIQYRSDYIKNVGENAEYNEITEINLGEMEDIDPEHFIIPVNISFISPNKRSFLLLVNKLSTTSSMTNISLLNEFFFYLVKNIEELKAEEIQQETQKYQETYFPESDSLLTGAKETTITSGDTLFPKETIIGHTLREWVKGTGEISLIDSEVINATIMQSSNCKTLDPVCLYHFREKYRELPYLAYTLGMPMGTGEEKERIQQFKDFLASLAPIIALKEFSFDKVQNDGVLEADNQIYQGSISFNAYGRSISDEEREEIAQILGGKCFLGENTDSINAEAAIKRVQENLLKLGDNLQSSDVVNNLEELNKIFEEIKQEENELNNYHKTIKLFEIFRMLKNANLCNA